MPLPYFLSALSSRTFREQLGNFLIIALTVSCCSALLAEVPASDAKLAKNEFQILDFTGKPRLLGTRGDEEMFLDCSIENVTGQAVDNVDITLKNSEEGLEYTRKTLDGRVRFEGIQPGTWNLSSITSGLVLKDIQMVLAKEMTVRELESSPSRAIQKRFELNPVAAGAGVVAAGVGIAAIADAAHESGTKRESSMAFPSPLSPSH